MTRIPVQPYRVGEFIDDPSTVEVPMNTPLNPMAAYSGFNYQDMGLAGGKPYSNAFLPSVGGQGDLGASPEQTRTNYLEMFPGVTPDKAAELTLLETLLSEKDKNEDLETFKQRLKASDESFERRLALAQRRGLESNLVGFALKGLPDMITKAAQARNQFVGDNIRIAAQPYGVGAVNIGGNYNL
jgi:hypothetical protein